MNVRVDSGKRAWIAGTPSLEWLLRTDLNSLKSNLSDTQPILNQVECLLYLSRTHLEEIAGKGRVLSDTLKELREAYEGLRQLALKTFPELVEYGIAKDEQSAPN